VNGPALEWLGLLAGAAVGESVRVEALEGADVAGLAGRDAAGAWIRVRAHLDADRTLKILYHEAAHHALGHIAKDQVTDDRPAAGSLRAVLMRPQERDQEAEADAWASHYLDGLGPQVRWLTERILDE
jgi:hypothetical protein